MAELKDLSEVTVTCANCKTQVTLPMETASISEQNFGVHFVRHPPDKPTSESVFNSNPELV